ncbi:SRPBCC family protein [soil metagenome]
MNKLDLSPLGDKEIVMKRTFDAPAQLVFDAMTKPELVQKWLHGLDGWTMPVCEIDLRVGGRYRYVWRKESDGQEMGMGGVYQEVRAPEKLVHTEKFDEAWYPGESIITSTFQEERGQTHFAATILYVSKEARDGVLASGAESGVAMSYDRLEALLAEGGA